MGMREKLLTGELYACDDDSVAAEQATWLEKVYEYNLTRPSEPEKRKAMMKNMFARLGKGCYIEPPFHANWGGKNVSLGDYVYANFNLTLVDDGVITIGDYTMIGPGVTIATAGHPILPALREKIYQYNMPVHIGRNCWLGAHVVVLPGVTIGDNTVVGAGSIVTKDLPANVVAVGNPCRILREINDRDREYYFKDRKISPEDLK